MTTNFYLKKEFEKVYPFKREEEPLLIGKRWANGLYCWHCRVILERGKDTCRYCHRSLREKSKSLNHGSVARELGFDKSDYKERKGVDTHSGFRWTMTNLQAITLFSQLPEDINIIEDEYKHQFTKKRFFQMLLECPVQYIDTKTNWS